MGDRARFPCVKCGGLVIKGDEPGELKCVGCSKRFYAEGPMPTQTSDRRPDEPQHDGGRCQGRQGRGQCTYPTENDGFCSRHSGQATNPDRQPAKVGRPASGARPGEMNKRRPLKEKVKESVDDQAKVIKTALKRAPSKPGLISALDEAIQQAMERIEIERKKVEVLKQARAILGGIDQ